MSKRALDPKVADHATSVIWNIVLLIALMGSLFYMVGK